jgi:vacuolar-type H+-ATPase subunit H
MSKYWNASGVGAADWLWANLKQNPEGLLFLAAGCALLLRRAHSTAYAQHDREYVQNSTRHRELVANKVAHQSSAGDWANDASSVAQKAREHASSLGKKMSDTAHDYTAAVSEYAHATREKVIEQSRQLAEKTQSRFHSLVREQPLAVAFVGLAAGAAVAAALPATTPERRVLGPARQRLYEAAGMARENITEAALAAGERLKSALHSDRAPWRHAPNRARAK